MQDGSFLGIREVGVVDASSLHGGGVERRIGAKQDAIDADLANGPFDQVRRDRSSARGVRKHVAVKAGLNASHLVRVIIVPTAADMSEDQPHLRKAVGPGNEVCREAVPFAAMR